MDYKDYIIWDIADKECRKISSRVIRSLQKLKDDCMQSGDDSPLKNVWDEICVQIQFQYFLCWDAYITTVKTIIGSEIEKLDKSGKEAIWLQTEEGCEWEAENDDFEGKIPYCIEDINEYILEEYILPEASDYTNKRIEKYLETY